MISITATVGTSAIIISLAANCIFAHIQDARRFYLSTDYARKPQTDVTEVSASAAAEQRYRTLFEKSLAGIAIFDTEGKLLDCNHAWAHIFGFGSTDELQGHAIAEPYFTSFESGSVLNELNHTGNCRREIALRRRDGSTVWVLQNFVVFPMTKDPRLIQSTAIDITARKQVEKELQHSEEHFRILVEQAPDGIFISDSQGRYLDVNSAGCEMLGYTREEILQSSIGDIVVPEERARVDAERRTLLDGHAVRNEWKFVRKDGSTFPGEVVGRGLPDGRLQGILRDMSERKHAEELIRQSEDRFRVALKHSPITVFHQDRDLRYTWIYNPHIYQSEKTVIGRTDSEILGAEQAARLTELKRKVQETQCGIREEVLVEYRGKTHFVDLTLEPLMDSDGKVIGITGATMDIARLQELTENLQHRQERLAHEKTYLEQQIESELGFEIVGQSPALMDVLRKAQIVAPTDSTVLLLGETGTGKELVARCIHELSGRRGNNFIKLNCAAVPTGLLESELFGHERGAFTGAVKEKVGRLELADKGTLFLDEVGELPLELQPKLLRALQDREFERLGGVRTIHVDVRIISATNRDLINEIAEKRFREDLFYRLNVFPIELPPLRERRSDIPMLVRHFIDKHATRMGKRIVDILEDHMAILENWDWPGNIRELENVIERMVILSKTVTLAPPPAELWSPQHLSEDSLLEIEREHIIRVLRETNGVLSGDDGAAKRLGVKRTTLQSMLKRFNIELRDFRRGVGPFGPN